jgi:hypothetical protein
MHINKARPNNNLSDKMMHVPTNLCLLEHIFHQVPVDDVRSQ